MDFLNQSVSFDAIIPKMSSQRNWKYTNREDENPILRWHKEYKTKQSKPKRVSEFQNLC